MNTDCNRIIYCVMYVDNYNRKAHTHLYQQCVLDKGQERKAILHVKIPALTIAK